MTTAGPRSRHPIAWRHRALLPRGWRARRIQLRRSTFVRDPGTPSNVAPRYLDRLDERARTMIREADTFFIASYVETPHILREATAVALPAEQQQALRVFLRAYRHGAGTDI